MTKMENYMLSVMFIPLGWFHSGECHPHPNRPADALLLLHRSQITKGNM